MKFILRQSGVNTIATIIVAVFAFTFFHSEFGFLSPQHHSHQAHQAHDFCQLVNGTTNQVQKSINAPILKPTVIKEICFHCVEEDFVQYQKTQSQRIENELLRVSLTDICIENHTFLI